MIFFWNHLCIVLLGFISAAILFYRFPRLPEKSKKLGKFPSLSVIIPARNEEKNLPLLLSDLLMGLLIGMVFAIIVASFKGGKAGPARPKPRSHRAPFARMQRTRVVKKVANSD